MKQSSQDRRRHARHRADPASLRLRFSFPDGRSPRYEASLRDVSVSGLSFLVDKSHPDLVEGDTLKAVEIEILGSRLHGEIVVMHRSRSDDGTGHCGGLFYPATDDDLLAWRRICERLAQAAAPEGT
jgi:hypothetical protein